MRELRVATFNIRNGFGLDGLNAWPFRRRRTAAAIAALGSAVVGLQEVYRFQLRSIVRHLDGVEAIGRGRGGGPPFGRCPGEHNPLLLQHERVRVVEHTTRWYGDQPDRPGHQLPGSRFPRIATIATLELRPDETRVQVACTHLDERSDANRLASTTQLATWLDPDLPRIVMGDLNAEPGDPELMALHAAGLRQALPLNARGTNHDFTGRTDGKRIDHVLVSDDVEVVRAEIHHPRPRGGLPSDHWPVVADVRIPRA